MDPIANKKHDQSASKLLEDQVSVVVEDDHDHDDIVPPTNYSSDDESVVTSRPRFGIFETDELMVDKLEEGNRDYDILKRSFVCGTKKSGKNVKVVGIYKKNYEKSVMDVARFDTFKVYADAVARRNSGEANIRYGWFGGSRDRICEILKHGFRYETSYGRGVCLSPVNSPIQSIKTLAADSDGLRYVLLCRVILGNSKSISSGSPKGHPSSQEFDSVVDNKSNYVIWEHKMNTHILPDFVISFKGDPIEGEQANIQVSQDAKKPLASQVSINGLIRELLNHVNSSKGAAVKKLHKAYGMRKISKPTFIRNLRMTVGDDVIREAVQCIR